VDYLAQALLLSSSNNECKIARKSQHINQRRQSEIPYQTSKDVFGDTKHTTPIFCNAFVFKDGFSARLGSISDYYLLNRHAIKTLKEDHISSNAIVDQKTQVGNDSMVGQGTTIAERCSVKKTVIGQHCKIGQNVKLANSIIMDYVTIEDKYFI
jgi:NDP-sugar pyrophosphorylase family protein